MLELVASGIVWLKLLSSCSCCRRIGRLMCGGWDGKTEVYVFISCIYASKRHTEECLTKPVERGEKPFAFFRL